jgi:GGDEF domain-containing protein
VYIVINVLLVCGAIALANRVSFSAIALDNVRHSGPAFLIMGFLAALAALLWTIEPISMLLLAGPLFALALYQRSALVSTIALRSALTDSLTGLGNHRSYEIELREAIERIEDGRALLTLCLLDVDDFKGINDVYGHQWAIRCSASCRRSWLAQPAHARTDSAGTSSRSSSTRTPRKPGTSSASTA